MPRRPVFRFAPSPNGPLHLGHAYSALLNFELARQTGGRFLLRIEDIDMARSRPNFVTGIIEDLTWLGLDWEKPVRRQSEHFDDYRRAAAALEAMALLYPCFASRAEIDKASHAPVRSDPDGAPIYPGIWRGAAEGLVEIRKQSDDPFALRLDMQRATALAGRLLSWQSFSPNDLATVQTRIAGPERWGDAVIVRKETPTSYHLSAVVDDSLQGVTHVVRGMDLEAATDLHRLLQALLGLPPPVYHHHALITSLGGRKLSKSLGDTSLAQMRREGVTPLDVRRLVGLPI